MKSAWHRVQFAMMNLYNKHLSSTMSYLESLGQFAFSLEVGCLRASDEESQSLIFRGRHLNLGTRLVHDALQSFGIIPSETRT